MFGEEMDKGEETVDMPRKREKTSDGLDEMPCDAKKCVLSRIQIFNV